MNFTIVHFFVESDANCLYVSSYVMLLSPNCEFDRNTSGPFYPYNIAVKLAFVLAIISETLISTVITNMKNWKWQSRFSCQYRFTLGLFLDNCKSNYRHGLCHCNLFYDEFSVYSDKWYFWFMAEFVNNMA